MKDRPINDVFYVPEYGELKVVAEDMVNECYGCVFQSPTNLFCRNDIEKVHSGECSFERREDRTDVIFIKAKGETNG